MQSTDALISELTFSSDMFSFTFRACSNLNMRTVITVLFTVVDVC